MDICVSIEGELMPAKALSSSPVRVTLAAGRHVATKPTRTSRWDTLIQYIKLTTLHGFRYIVERGLHPTHRILWVLICTTAVAGAGCMIFSVWSKYVNSPTITVVNDTDYPIYKIPFPAVTICSRTKVIKGKAMNFFRRHLKTDNPEIVQPYMNAMLPLNYLYYPRYYLARDYTVKLNLSLYVLDGVNITSLMLEVMPKCDEIFHSCFWKGDSKDCCSIFQLQNTEEGFCYSFNSRVLLDRTLRTENPLRNYAKGSATGLELFLRNTTLDYLDNDSRPPGSNIYVHNPFEYPDVSMGFFAPFNTEKVVRLQVSPTITETTEEVKRIPKDVRRCIFQDESKMKFGEIYSQHTCQMECRIEFIKKHCGCTPYFFYSRSKTVCGMHNFVCLSDINTRLRINQPPPGVEGYSYDSNTTTISCNCLKACNKAQYIVEQSFTESIVIENQTYLDIHFKQLGGVSYRTDVLFGWMDLLVSFGGICGLFLGFSLISVLEFFYWMIVRVLFNCTPNENRECKCPVCVKLEEKLYPRKYNGASFPDQNTHVRTLNNQSRIFPVGGSMQDTSINF